MDKNDTMEKVVALCKRKGFIFPGSEIYGGLANTWDYGPYGVQLKKNIKDYWWKTFVENREDIVGLDAAILMNPKTWEASGHVASFSDPLIDSKSSGHRYRADKLIEEYSEQRPKNWAGEKTPLDDLYDFILEMKIPDPKTGKCEWTKPRQFNLMFKTHQGVVEESATEIYLRPETAQGIFVNFKNVVQSTRVKMPFGIAQIGKAFRNEITPGNFTFRTREFEQMEIEYFLPANNPELVKEKFEQWKQAAKKWFLDIGVKEENLRFREHEKDELSHYSSMTFDIEYLFPFGWGELMGLAYRGDFDLKQHQEYSREDLEYRDPVSNEKYLPHVIEPSFGCDRATLITLLDAYHEDEINGEARVVMRFDPKIAPVKAAILPLIKKDQLTDLAKNIQKNLSKFFHIEYDDSAAIGKRYRRQDEIGTPFCITVDFDGLEDETVTLRHRDSTEQERVKIADLAGKIASYL